MAEARQLTRPVYGYHVHYWSRFGEPVGPAAYFAEGWQPALTPVQVTRPLAPKVAKAVCRIDLGVAGVHAWDWPQVVAPDDMLAIVEARPAEERAAVFGGFLTDINWGYQAASEAATVVAVGRAQRLLVDQAYLVYGRYMTDANGTVSHYSGLPCAFNAGGRPNRSASPDEDGVYTFTADDAAGASYWTAQTALVYLTRRYNAAETWLANPTVLAATRPAGDWTCEVDGLPLWVALAEVGDRVGYDIYEQVTTGADGNPEHAITAVERHTGAEVTIRHQGPDPATGELAGLDVNWTANYSADITETVASSVTAPVVAGARDLYEVQAVLQPAFAPGEVALADGEAATPYAQAGAEYFARHVEGGASYDADAGRLWDANTDGYWTDKLDAATDGDAAAWAGQTPGSWPAMAHRALPRLAAATAGGEQPDTLLEVSYDGGSSWGAYAGAYDLLPGRLAVRLTDGNLAEVLPSDSTDFTDNFFSRCADDLSQVRLRLTCTIEGPDRQVTARARRATAGTAFSTGQWFDRGALGGAHLGAAGQAALDAAAEAIVDEHEGRLIEAGLPIAWPDASYELTQQVTRIEGLEYDLGLLAGGGVRYPRIVQIVQHLQASTWGMQLTLGTERKAVVV